MITFQSLDDVRTWNAEQSWHARSHYKACVAGIDRRFRFELRRNAYDFQSYVRVETLDPATLQWSALVSRAIDQTPAASMSYVDDRPDMDAIDMTISLLLADVEAILS